MQIQQDSQEKSSWLQALSSLKIFVTQNSQFISTYSSKILKRISLTQYPIEGCQKAWRRFSQIINQRISESNNKSQPLLSNLFFWVIPLWAASYSLINAFIERYLKGIEVQKIDSVGFSQVCQELNLGKRWNLDKDNIDEILYIPFYILEQLVMKGLEVASSLQQRLTWIRGQNQTHLESNIQGQQLLEIELKMLQASLSQLNSIVQTMSKQKQFYSKDNAVIKFDYIIQQYELISNSQKTLALKFIKRIRLIRRWKSIDKKRVERLKQRRMNIYQLINGEENYLFGLKEYIQNVKNPIQKLNILTPNQFRILFSSIVEIKTLHQNIYSMLKKEYDEYNDQQCYAPIIKHIIPFFKIYTDYILNAEAAQKFMKNLIRDNPSISQICRQYTLKTKKLAENELLQPTFRIARYEALFQQIIKKTSTSHKDYNIFLEVQVEFKKVLRQVNNEVDRIIRSMRLQELDRQFGTPALPIFQRDREYLQQYSLTLIREPYPQQVILIIFNNLLLIIDEPTRKLQKAIKINQQFFARREEDNKNYRNMVTIHSDGFITFTLGSDDVYANKAKQLYHILKSITKESGQLVYISVLGTEEIGSTSFAKFTQYIVEVKYLDIKKILHLRFSIILQMVQKMQTYYKDSLKISEEECLRKSWFNSHKSKTIQARKLIIGQIFQKLFNHELIKNNPQYFLTFLNLPYNFYEIAKSSYEKRISVTQTVTLSRLKRAYLTKKEEKEAFTILCGTEIKLGRDLFHDFQNAQQLKKLKQSADKIQIKIITLDDEQPATLSITQYDTVEQVCNRISLLRGLRSNRDFRLFHQIGKKQLRVLQHEQLITKIFQFPQRRQNIAQGFYGRFKNTIKNMVFPQTYPTLIFKKYYYLPYEIEQVQMRKDLVRLKLLVHQIFAQIKEGKYQLNFDQYLLFLSMMLYIIADGKIDQVRNIDSSFIHRIIPDTIFKLKNYSEVQWMEKCHRHLKRLHEEILKVIEFNQAQYQQGKIKIESVSKQSLYFGPKYLSSQIALNKIRTNPIFGSNLFYVQPHNDCYKKLQDKNLKVAYNIWLGVSIESVKLLSPSSKQLIFELRYEDIQKTQVFSEAIVFRTNGMIEQEYRLNTYQSFEISQLVKYNKAMNEVLTDLKNDSELNIRVKSYRQQLIQYRSTCDDGSTELIFQLA